MASLIDSLGRNFSSDGFIPRRICGLWPDWLVWEHVSGNALVWLAYFALPMILWRIGQRRADWVPFRGVVRAFALFIGLCGVGHFLDMLSFFHPLYRLSGHVLIATGLASCWTVWSLRQVWPAIMAMKSPAELERVVAERTRELAVANEALREGEGRFRQIAESIPQQAWMAGPDGYLFWYNQRWYDYTGATPEQMEGWGWQSVHDPAVLPSVLESWTASIANGKAFDMTFPIRGADGRFRKFLSRAVPSCDAEGRVLLWFGTNTDIDEQMRAEDAIRDSESRTRAILNAADDAIITIDERGIAESLNPAAERLFGYSTAEVLGQNIKMLMPNPFHDDHDGYLASYRAMGRKKLIGIGRDVVGRRRDGTTFPMHLAVSELWLGGRRMFTGIARDISERIEVEEELRRSRDEAMAASRAKSAFLANMSHEIRTPMNGVLGMLDLTLASPLEARQRGYLSLAKSSAQTLLRLLNDILDFSKIEAGQLELETAPFSLRESFGYAFKALAEQVRAKGLKLSCSVDPEVPDSVLGDPGRLNQILVNLLSNAEKFTERGAIDVRVVLESRTEADVEIHVSVRDTGIGIPPEKQEQIFSAFTQADSSTTRKYGGTGLGLTICSQLVESMGGRIWVESVVGLGSIFHFTMRLGLWKGKLAELPSSSVALEGLTVLAVDDDPTDLLLIEEFVSSFGMKVTGVDGAPAAIAAMSRAREAGQPYALVLVDVRMPGMDGFELAASLRREAERDGTAIMMLASDSDRGDTGRCAAVGAGAFLLKPMRESEFLDAIQKCMGLPRRDPPPPSVPLRILLAEDTPVNQVLAVALLEERGHEVALAHDGREALDLLEQGSFDLILMDLQMPRMDGFETTAAIRAGEADMGRRVPILALTAYAMKGDRERCLAAGMDGYISKPIVPEQFIATVERLGPMPNEPAPKPEVGREPGPDVDARVFDLTEALARVCGKRSLLQKMAELFLADCPGLLDQIRAALATGDGPMLQRAAHRMKGSAANLSASRVVEVASRLEEAGRGGRLAEADSGSVELADEVVKLRGALENLKGEATPCAS